MNSYHARHLSLGVVMLAWLTGCDGDTSSHGRADASSTDSGSRDAADNDVRVEASHGDTGTTDSGGEETGATEGGTEDAGDASLDADSSVPFCLGCVEIRVGRPVVVRGPAGDELDTAFSAMVLGGGGWRGFSANGSTYAIDGDQPWEMGGPRTLVLSPGPAGSDSECGQWINDVKPEAGGHQAFIHWERSCNYAQGQTHKSMAYATSVDEGLSWTVQGMIISGTDAPTPNTNTGEGDCHVVEGADSYFYAYCLRTKDYQTIVARASESNPGPGMWQKYYQGAWSEPGLGGQADALGFFGPTAGRWVSQDQMLTLVPDKWFGGLKMAFAADRVHFNTLEEPLLALDDADWVRPAPTELVAYPSVFNPVDGSRQLDGAFLLAHTYVQPGEDFSQRYLVFRDVTIQHGASEISPQVGVALARWYNAANKDRWSTTAPVPGNFESYAFEGVQGYLMTRAHPTLPTTRLEDCVGTWPGHPEHILTMDGTCSPAGYTRLRTAGWVFEGKQPGTIPLYRCYNEVEQHHFASHTEDCEGLGNMEFLLGYMLAQ